MTPLFDRLSGLVQRARELSAEQRDAFIDEVTGDDAELAGEIRRQLRHGGGHVRSAATDALLQKLTSAPRLDTGRYVLEGEIDRGGMGAVLRIHDAHLNRRLAMKVMLERAAAKDAEDARLSQQLLGRFLEEAQVTSQLDHPGVVPVHELGLDASGKVYFTMRLVKGRNASEAFALARAETDGWTRTRALEIVLKVCDTMAYAHEKGVLHRDLKPGNVMVGRFGEVYVMDWGLAKVLGQEDKHDLRIRDQDLVPSSVVGTVRHDDVGSDGGSPVMTMGGQRLGTPSYMSPEQARSEELDGRADVYSIGGMMYELLTGRAPYTVPGQQRRAYDVLEDVVDKAPKRIDEITKGVPAELVAIVEKAMARARGDRYASVLELAADLRAFIDQRVVRAYRTGALVEMRLWMRRNRALAGSLAAAVVILVGGVAGTTFFAIHADAKARELEWSSYVGNVQIAARYLELGQFVSLRERLAACPERLRGWEWRCLMAQSDQYLVALPHPSGVFLASYSPDGSRIVTTSLDRTARIWDAASGVCLGELKIDGLRQVSWSCDGKRITAPANEHHTACVWNAATGARIAAMRHGDTVNSASFDPGGTRIVTTSNDNTARIWHAADGTHLLELKGHTDAVRAASFNADGTRVVTASQDRSARVWDATSGSAVVVLMGHADAVLSASFSSAGSHVLTSSADGTARVWDAASGNCIVRIAPADAVYSPAFSPDGTRVVTGSSGKTARVWDAATGACLVELIGHSESVVTAAFRPDGARVVTASRDKTARIWDVASGACLAELRGHSQMLCEASFSPDGSRVVTSSFDHTAMIWDAQATTTTAGLTPTASDRQASFSADGTRWLTAPARTWLDFSGLGNYGETAQVWDAVTGAKLAELIGHTSSVYCASFSPDGTRVVTGSRDTTARTWDAATGEILAELRGHGAQVNCASFSPDGSRVVTAADDKTARVWDATSGALLAELLGHDGAVFSASFSPDGRRVVTTSENPAAGIWDAVTGTCLAWLDHADHVSSASFSPEGTRVVTASFDRTACIWDAASGSRLSELRHANAVVSAAFDPHGERIVTIPTNGEAPRLWAASSGTCIAELRAQLAHVTAATFVHDGSRVVTFSGDAIHIYDAVTGANLAELRPAEGGSGAFSQDGTRLVTPLRSGAARIWHSTPYRDRLPAIQKAREALTVMTPRVIKRLHGGEGPIAVRKSIQADASLTAEQRTAGMIAVQAWLDDRAEKK